MTKALIRSTNVRYFGKSASYLASLIATTGLLQLMFGFLALSSASAVEDVTNEVQLLGNPASIKYPSSSQAYSRNSQDMQFFQGKIYLGQGDGTKNTGPAEVWAFDTASGQFVKELTTSEEVIGKYRTIDGELVIPGLDSRESWSLGNYYKNNGSGWQKFRSIPNGVHVFDLYRFQNRLFAGLGTNKTYHTAKSMDGGKSWSPVYADKNPWRIYSLFELNGRLFASSPLSSNVYRFNGQRFARISHRFFTGAEVSSKYQPIYMGQNEKFGNRLVYLLATPGRDGEAVGFNVASSPTDVKKVSLPSNLKLRDLFCRQDKCYLLGFIYNGPRNYTITVSQSSNLTQWRELFRFQADTFARSFEKDKSNNFYFSLGSSATEPSPATGNVLRVSQAAWSR